LGLTIVSQIIEDLRGYIRVRANEPQGTKFTVEFPVEIENLVEKRVVHS
jgi:signal transduction histidine kinase